MKLPHLPFQKIKEANIFIFAANACFSVISVTFAFRIKF